MISPVDQPIVEEQPNNDASHLHTNMANRDGQFSIGLFEIGKIELCLLSFICCPVAAAYSRTLLDQSNLIYNCFCLPLIPYR